MELSNRITKGKLLNGKSNGKDVISDSGDELISKIPQMNKRPNAYEEKHKISWQGKYIKDLIYGGLDGIITTFAIVSGVAGASLSSSVILILGLANLLADGFSMAVSNYMGTKSEIEYAKKQREREEYEIQHSPEDEIEEIREIFRKKGFEGEDLERVVRVITSDKKVWVDTMMLEELGILEDDQSPLISALVTFVSFYLIGSIPLSSYFLAIFYPSILPQCFHLTILLTGMTIFSMGAMKSQVTGSSWLTSGLNMLLVGGTAAMVAYVVGFWLRHFQFEDTLPM